MKVDTTPTINDVRPPYINLANKSLPMASVPRICEQVGAELNAAGSDVYGSKFKIKGKRISLTFLFFLPLILEFVSESSAENFSYLEGLNSVIIIDSLESKVG